MKRKHDIVIERATDCWLTKQPERLQARLIQFRRKMERERFRPTTVQLYLARGREFLEYLERNEKQPESAGPSDIDAFLQARLRRARQHGGRSQRLPDWRWGYTGAIRCMLRSIQGQWPPASAVDDQEARFQKHLDDLDFCHGYRALHHHHARCFLKYLDERGLLPDTVKPTDVSGYFHAAVKLYRKRNPNLVKNKKRWLTIHRRIIHRLLQSVQGEWPPGSAPSPWLSKLRTHVEQAGYCKDHIAMRVSAARQFLRYLSERHIAPEVASTAEMDAFIQQKLSQTRSKNRRICRSKYRSPICQLMRLIHPVWPPPQQPAGPIERFVCVVHHGYVGWMRDVHGFSKPTLLKNGGESKRFLHWLGPRASYKTLSSLTVSDIDAYFHHRMPELRRATRRGVCGCLRSFMKYLHSEGRLRRDLSLAITGPPRYAFAEIPRAFSEDDVQKLLQTVEHDRSQSGLRNRAILLLLVTYGLRAGEVARLRLEDIDWREERIRIRQSKTGAESHLPLVAPVGNALLEYLQRGRPQSERREVFLGIYAPHNPFSCGSSLASLIQHRVKRAGIKTDGRHGAHALRFARAIQLLRASVPVKTIGDMLGHQSADSTGVYLRLAEDDLRAISLEIAE